MSNFAFVSIFFYVRNKHFWNREPKKIYNTLKCFLFFLINVNIISFCWELKLSVIFKSAKHLEIQRRILLNYSLSIEILNTAHLNLQTKHIILLSKPQHCFCYLITLTNCFFFSLFGEFTYLILCTSTLTTSSKN